MAGLTLQNLFGSNATQDIDQIIIEKSDLASNTNFLAQDQNDGESILVGIILQAQSLGLDTSHRDGLGNFDANINQQVAISDPIQSFVNRSDSSGEVYLFERQSILIDLDKKLQGINPNDY